MCPPECLHYLYAGSRAPLAPALGGPAIDSLNGGLVLPHEHRIRPALSRFEYLADLTHTLFEGFPTHSGERWFSTEPVFSFDRDRVNSNRWTMMEHTGTHIDAPLHFSADGTSVDLLPVEDLIAPLAVIDISERAQDDADALVTPRDIENWESRYGPLPDGACVAMNAGWDRLLNEPRYANCDEDGRFHTPGFHPEAGALLLERANVRGIAVDTLSLDAGLASQGRFPVHRLWLGAGRWGIEALANLWHVPESGAALIVGAPKVRGATGGPCRVLALY